MSTSNLFEKSEIVEWKHNISKYESTKQLHSHLYNALYKYTLSNKYINHIR